MKRAGKQLTALLAGFGMLILIFDSATAMTGAASGLWLCIRTVIPSLFPMFVLSSVVMAGASELDFSLLTPVLGRCGIPSGAEAVWIAGLLGGYPVGVAAAFRVPGSRKQCNLLAGLCSHAGPAFLFGMLGPVFGSGAIPAFLWAVQAAAALLTGRLLSPGGTQWQMLKPPRISGTVDHLRGSIRSMACVCGWVVLFSVLQAFFSRWIPGVLSGTAGTLVSGFLELTGGCLRLPEIRSDAGRLAAAAVLLGWGGVCVAMQASSLGADLSVFLPVKAVQAVLCGALSIACLPILFPNETQWYRISLISGAFVLFVILFPMISKITVAKRDGIVYNKKRI